MSYVVLARKYRPRSFAQMVGQEHVVQALGNALAQQRLHHAYLFTGTRGIGKTTVSRILAKSLNCTGPDGTGGITAQPCGQCQACTEIDADRYLDYVEMDAASNGGKDEIRELIERAAYKPGVGRFKVFMIDEAHQLSKDAFNALLKTLEEPPEYLKFVLATTDPDKVLPTVLSRCLQFNLRPMPPEVVSSHLGQVLKAEGVAHDAGSLRLLGRAARGSMRDGLSLTDQAIAYGGGSLHEAGVRAMLGAVDRHHAAALVEALAQRDGAALLQRIQQLRSLGLSASGTLEEVAQLLQHMAVEQAVPGALDAQDGELADARRLAPLLPPDQTQLLYSIVLHGRGELGLMSDDYGALTMVLLRLLAFAPAGVPAATPNAATPASPSAAPSAAASGASRGAPAPASSRAASTVQAATPQPAPVPMPTAPVAAAQPRPAAPVAAVVVARSPEPPPWLDIPVEDEYGSAASPSALPTPPTAPLRAPAPPALAVPAAPPPAALPSAAAPAFVPTPLGERWAAVVGPLVASGAVTALLRELALQAGLLEQGRSTDGTALWRLVVERDSLRSDALRDKLAAALQVALGHALQLELVAGVPQDSPARREAADRQQRQQAAEQAIHNDPLVRELMSQFKTARIVPGSIKPL